MSALIDRIQQHAVHDGDCWRWIGARQSCGGTPMMNWRGKVSNVRRHILEDRGVPMKGYLAWISCGNPDCVNPEHVVRVSRSKISVSVARDMDAATKLRKARLTAEAARSRTTTKLSLEQARAIRLDDRPQRVIAEEYGVDQYAIWAIKSGKTWREYNANPFSSLY